MRSGTLKQKDRILVFRSTKKLRSSDSTILRHEHSASFSNYSQTEGCSLLAICDLFSIGVDVESILQPERDWTRLAERFFHPFEAAAVKKAGAQRRKIHFLKIWVQKEALAKATRRGIATTFPTFSVVPKLRLEAAFKKRFGDHWSIRILRPTAAHIGAVAFRSKLPVSIRYRPFMK